MEIKNLATGIVQAASELFYRFFFNESESESEDDYYENHLINEVKKRICRQPPVRLGGLVEEAVPEMSSKEFQSHFRMGKESFHWTLSRIRPYLEMGNRVGRPNISAERQLLAALYLLATPDSYRSIGVKFNMGKSSLWKCFLNTVTALNSLSPQVIKWPNRDQREINAAQFQRLGRMQGVIGAIDGTYVPIKAPQEEPQAYVNRKMFHGVTLQAICDQDRNFIDCFAGFPSSAHDSRVFRNSNIFAQIMNHPQDFFERRQFIIGDKAYPVLDWCLPPYINRGNLDPRQINFNRAHAKTRQVIERSFALLFGRFRRLQHLDMGRADLISATIFACCVLHNICLQFPEELYQYENDGLNFVVEDNALYNREAPDVALLENGMFLRDYIAQQIYNNDI